MKKLMVILIGMLPIVASAQESQLNSLFNKYSGQEGYTSIHITEHLFNMFKDVNSEQQEKEFKDAVSGLEAIKILVADEEKGEAVAQFENELSSIFSNDLFKELMVIRDGEETVAFFIKENEGFINEFAMKVTGSGEPFLLFLKGNIDLEKISSLSKTMNVKGFEHLEGVEE